MATDILSLQEISKGTAVELQYKLSESDRQAIIQRSQFVKTSIKIERQRQAFIEKNGNEFGLDENSGFV